MSLALQTRNQLATAFTGQAYNEIKSILDLREGFGDLYYVDSVSGSDTNTGVEWESAMATVNEAIKKTTANRGDVILVAPGHSETLTADAAVNMDKAGVSVFGTGSGADIPVFDFTTSTAADWKMNAASCSIANLLFTAGIDDQDMMIEVSGDDCTISFCEFREGLKSALTAITVGVADADADRCHIHHCNFRMDQPTITNKGNAAISIATDNDNVVIEECHIYGDFDDAGISVPVGGDASDFLVIRGNYIENTASGQHAIEITTAGTMVGGSITDNILVADAPATTLEPHTLFVDGNTPLDKLSASGGEEFFVDSGSGVDSGDGSSLSPFAKLDFAIGQCTANSGAKIFCVAGHAETVTADSFVDMDVAGVTVIGLGVGADRPTFNYTTATTADFKMAAASCKIENLLFTVGITNVDMCVEVTGDDCEISNCEFREGSQSMLTAITIATADGEGDRTWIHDCKFRMDEPGITNVGNAAIELAADVDNVVIEDNHIYGDFDDAGISVPVGADASDFLTIRRNYVENTFAANHAIEITTAGTMVGGSITDNRLVADATATLLEPHTLQCLGNLGHIGGTNEGDFPVPGQIYGTRGARFVRTTTAAMSSGHGTADDPAQFTVTGQVICRCFGVVTTAITSTSNNGTLSLGTPDAEALFVPAITMDGTNGSQHDILANETTTRNGDNLETGGEWAVITNGVDIQEFIATNNMTAGVIQWYCEWSPLSTDGDVKAV